MTKQIKTPAGLTAGAACVVGDNRSDIASENFNNIVSEFNERKTQRLELPLSAGLVSRLQIVGSFVASCGEASTITGKKETPASVCDQAGGTVGPHESLAAIASSFESSTLCGKNAIVAPFGAQKDARKRGALRVECGLEAYAVASEKNLNTFSILESIGWREVIHHNIESDPTRKTKALAIELLLMEAKFQLAMGAATPLHYDAHLCSPATRVDEKPSLRRKQASTTTWQTGWVYRVHPNLLVEVARG